MYKKILIAIDNSLHSNACIDIGIAFSQKFGSKLVGCHVYDASLHQKRFRDMEKGLPPQYQDEKELQRQRDLHGSLINLGLKLISDSYLDVFRKKCQEANVPHEGLLLEGKNYHELIKEARKNGYDLVILGVVGLGAVKGSVIGSVCERVVRRINTDVLIVKNNKMDGSVVVGVDGSTLSLSGAKSAIEFTRRFDMPLSAVSVFDPHYHRVAFESIATVLSKEAGQVFKFKEQETLHEEIIDKGLAKIYQNHLDKVSGLAESAGIKMNTTLMDGKPYSKILQYVENAKPAMLILGRTGVHSTNGLDIGSNAENLLRLAPCNILLTGEGSLHGTSEVSPESRGVSVSQRASGVAAPKEAKSGKEFLNYAVNKREVWEETPVAAGVTVSWTREAHEQTEKIPSFVRELVRKRIEKYAIEKGYTEITKEVVSEAKNAIASDSAFHKV